MRILLKVFVTVILGLGSLGALAIAVMGLGDLLLATLMLSLCIWCAGAAWFLNFRARVSPRTRRATAVLLAAFPLCFAVAWSNGWRVQRSLEQRNWITYQSVHFRFHYAPDYPRASEIESFARIHDSAFESICTYLRVSLSDRTDFFIYEKLDEGVAIPDWNEIRADDDQSIGHEMTHIIASHIADGRQKIRLLDEGIATWLNQSKRTRDHHRAAWEYIQKDSLPPLGELIPGPAFRHHRPPPYFPAASFVGYLITRFGIDAFRRLWTANAAYPELYSMAGDLRLTKYFSWIPSERAHFESTVMDVYGRTLGDLESEWRQWLDRKYRS